MPLRAAAAGSVQPDRLALGRASRLLGVDPDTLRRWADEGRVPAFTTPGGHRRFDRRSLEQLVADRRAGPAGALAGLGATQDRLSAAYRRRYDRPPAAAPDPRASIPPADHERFRESGRLLVTALVRRLDGADGESEAAEREALALAGELGDRLACHGVPLPDAVAMFVAARTPFLDELRAMARRRGVDPARVNRLYDTATGLLDRLLLAFVAAHAAAGSASAIQPWADLPGQPEGDPWT
jgi:excisionase family DNA binding protein